MDTTNALQAVAIVVDGYSTGQFYPQAIRGKGLRPVHVSSGTEKHSPGLNAYVSEALEHMRSDYDAMLHGWSEMEELVARLSALSPCCVMAGCEMGVEMADRLAGRLGLPGNDAATSYIRRDKLAMHDTLANAGLASLASLATDNLCEALAFAADLDRWPVVVKPLRSAATEGVRFCRSAEELREAFNSLLGSFSQFGERNARVLIQQCARGREFAVNTVSRDGRHILSDLWAYEKIPTPGGAPLYDRTQLVRILDQGHHAIIDYTLKVLDALGIRIGPAHTEVMLTEQGPVLIESGARPMGGAFPQELIQESLGHTQIEWAVDSYTDADAFAANARQPYRPTHSFCVKSLISTQEGAVKSIPAIALASRLPSVRCGNFIALFSSGHVSRTVDLLTNPAHIFLYHRDQAVVDADWSTLRELEVEAQNELFELNPAEAFASHDDWFAHVPDECWLKPESEAQRDADIIWQALGLSAGERLLDCPCGDARIGVLLAEKGAIVTGVDLNPRFITRAGERFAAAGISAELRVGDMRALDDRSAFDAIANWFNSFGYFGIEDDFQVLLHFAAALRPGGRLLVEAPNRTGLLGNLVRRRDAEAGKGSTVDWDETTERLVTHLTVSGPDGEYEVKSGVRMYSLPQYRLLIRLAGLSLERVYGEGLTPFGEHSRRMIMVAVKPGV
ncbi:MAG: methyltransferase domain-containing protein [Syntrophales bacterium]